VRQGRKEKVKVEKGRKSKGQGLGIREQSGNKEQEKNYHKIMVFFVIRCYIRY
jgi:hypothetical protein